MYILYNTNSRERRYFRKMTDNGPEFTDNVDEAEAFSSHEDASIRRAAVLPWALVQIVIG